SYRRRRGNRCTEWNSASGVHKSKGRPFDARSLEPLEGCHAGDGDVSAHRAYGGAAQVRAGQAPEVVEVSAPSDGCARDPLGLEEEPPGGDQPVGERDLTVLG